MDRQSKFSDKFCLRLIEKARRAKYGIKITTNDWALLRSRLYAVLRANGIPRDFRVSVAPDSSGLFVMKRIMLEDVKENKDHRSLD